MLLRLDVCCWVDQRPATEGKCVFVYVPPREATWGDVMKSRMQRLSNTSKWDVGLDGPNTAGTSVGGWLVCAGGGAGREEQPSASGDDLSFLSSFSSSPHPR